MGLVPTLDKKATIKKVREFFSENEYYPTIKRRAGEYGLKSPQMDITGIRGSRFGNSTEKMMVMFAEYAKAKRTVDDAIAGCRQMSQVILKKRYIDGWGIYDVRPLVNRYGHETYTNADKYACLEFADCLERKAWENNVDSEIIPNLLVFEKNGS